MICANRDRCAVLVFAAVLVVAGAFCVAIGMWDQGESNSQIERYLIGTGALALVVGVILAAGATLLARPIRQDGLGATAQM